MSNIIDNSDCPYNCIDGKVFDTSVGKKVPCPHCGDKFKEIASGKSVAKDGRTFEEILALPKSYKGSEYSFENTVPDLASLTEGSKTNIQGFLQKLINQAVLGEKPPCSCYINLGMNADILNFIYTYLKHCFKNSLIVTPVISTTDLVALRFLAEGFDTKATSLVEKVLGVCYQELEVADICVVTLDAGVSRNGVYAVKGLLEARDRKGLSTLVFTNANLPASLKQQIVVPNRQKCFHLLFPVEVEYIRSEEEVTSVDDTDSCNPLSENNKPVNAEYNTITQESIKSLMNATSLGQMNSL